MKVMIIKSLMLVFIVIALVHYALYLKTGRLPWGEGSPSISLPSLPKSLPGLDTVTGSGTTKLYKWVDENGVIHYSQEPPAGEQQAEAMELDGSKLNLIPGVVIPEAAGKPPTPKPTADDYVLNDGKTPVEKAREAAELLEARNREQQKILDSL